MHGGFKSSDLPRRGSHDQDICDYVVMRVRFLWFSKITVPPDCLGRTGTPPVSLAFAGQSQARERGTVVSAGTARYHCFTVYTYSIIFVVSLLC